MKMLRRINFLIVIAGCYGFLCIYSAYETPVMQAKGYSEYWINSPVFHVPGNLIAKPMISMFGGHSLFLTLGIFGFFIFMARYYFINKFWESEEQSHFTDGSGGDGSEVGE